MATKMDTKNIMKRVQSGAETAAWTASGMVLERVVHSLLSRYSAAFRGQSAQSASYISGAVSSVLLAVVGLKVLPRLKVKKADTATTLLVTGALLSSARPLIDVATVKVLDAVKLGSAASMPQIMESQSASPMALVGGYSAPMALVGGYGAPRVRTSIRSARK